MRRFAFAFLAALACGSVAAQGAATATDDLEFGCRGQPGSDQESPPKLARVVSAPAGRSYFHDDGKGCPAAADCRRKAYVIAGDAVIVDRSAGGWTCAWYAGKRGPTMGYLRTADLEGEEPAHELLAYDWLGVWEEIRSQPTGDQPANTLEFTLHDAGLGVSGEALWYGNVVDGERVVHTGSINQEGLELEHDWAGLSPEDEHGCEVQFCWVGEFVVARDNHRCGGANVTFSGVYRRAGPPHARSQSARHQEAR